MKVLYSGPEDTSQITHQVPSMKSMTDESVAWKYLNTKLNHVKCYRSSMLKFSCSCIRIKVTEI